MKKFGIYVLMLLLTTTVLAQDKMSLFSSMDQKNILNHMDIGVNVGTVGIGIDVAVPVGDYVRIRAGYNYMPRFNLHSNFPIETRSGSISELLNKVGYIDAAIKSYGIDINSEEFKDYKLMLDKFRNVEPKDYVSMGMKPNLHQFKFLVDVMPFKHNKHWSFTAGFFVGPSVVGEACNLEKETLLLEAINAYNSVYAQYPENGLGGHGYLQTDGAKTDPFFKYGLAGFPLGYFADGEKAMMVPGADNTVRAEMKVSKFRPYLGFGYNTHLSRNKKWKLNVDAGVLFLCGKPKVYVDNVYKFDASPLVMDENDTYVSGIGYYDKYSQYEYYGEIVRYTYNPETGEEAYIDCSNIQNRVDLVHDLHDMPAGKVRDMVNTISKFKVYPNLSVTFSYRLY